MLEQTVYELNKLLNCSCYQYMYKIFYLTGQSMSERSRKIERSHQPETPEDRYRSHLKLPRRIQTLSDP